VLRGPNASPAVPGAGEAVGRLRETASRVSQKWPDFLWIVRHAQSDGNVARDVAESAGEARIRLATRDVDVPLSELGCRQADALGRWFASLSEPERPTRIYASPYVRALDTAHRIAATPGLEELSPVLDERLREREFGILDGLTRAGIEARYPDEARRRGPLGKFYYRPPGGESWCDVILRLRSVIGTLTRDASRERVQLVTHTVAVLCFRYLLERLSESRILEIDRETEIANCSVTAYAFDPSKGHHGKLVLTLFNSVAALEHEQAGVTAEDDGPKSA
jgi:2,3-bisphosphoglycerate-dependent phosphoglycerate mutase